MIALAWIIVIACGSTAHPNATTTPQIHPTTPHTTTTNTTTKPTTPPICPNDPKRCPTKASLIADFISKSKYHFKALQYDHQGYYKALKWNLDMAFKSLEGQFGNLISDVQYNMKTQFTNVQKQNDALKSEIIALKSQPTQNKSTVKDEVTEIKTQITGLKQQVTDGLKTLTGHVRALHCHSGKWINGTWYTILKCDPRCNSATASHMCSQIGATLAPMRTEAVYNIMNTYRKKELGINGGLYIDGSDYAREGTWRYHDGTRMTYTNWDTGEPNGGTRANNIFIYADKMHDAYTFNTWNGVACAWD